MQHHLVVDPKMLPNRVPIWLAIFEQPPARGVFRLDPLPHKTARDARNARLQSTRCS